MFLKIGLIGAPRSGKSIIGNYFVNYKKFVQFAFADRIKKEFFDQFDLSEEDFEEAKKYSPKTEKMIRKELWAYSDRMRELNGDCYFIVPVVSEIEKYEGNVIVTDIRTEEELLALRKIGMKFIVIVRDILPNKEEGVQGTRIGCDSVSDFEIFENKFEDFDSLYIGCSLLYEKLME
jgi:hypothetical protein